MFKNKYNNLKRIMPYFKKEKKLIYILITVMILASTLGVLLPYFYSKRLMVITDTNFEMVLKYSFLIILIIFFHHIFWYFWEKLGAVLTNKVSFDIRCDLTNKITTINYQRIKSNSSGYYIERYYDDVIEVSGFISTLLGTLVDILTNFSFLILIFILSYKIVIFLSIGIILLYIIDIIKIKKDLYYTEKLKELSELLNSKITENIKGSKEIKGLGIRNQVVNSTQNVIERIKNEKIKKYNILAILSRLKTFTYYSIHTFLIIYSIGVLIPNKEMSLVFLLMILDYMGFVLELVGYIANIKDIFVKNDFRAKRLLEVLDNKNIDKFGKIKKIDNYNILVKNLSYSYEDNNKLVLKSVNFTIKENTLSIFLGESGSGKSTLFDILTKVLVVPNNRVFIGGKDINKLSEECFRNNISIITQEPFLINNTILNNIRIVKPMASKEEVINACKLANIHNEINAMEKKYNTKVFENGTNLSGGQKQRISIARAFLKDANIILFDEPTSSLDKNNHDNFFKTLKTLKNKKTVLLIAHKIDDLEIFDNIFTIKEGIINKK